MKLILLISMFLILSFISVSSFEKGREDETERN